MNNEEKFEALKIDAIKNYENYINAIKSFSYNDLKDLHKRMALLEKYKHSIISNAEYRSFIYQNLGGWQEPPDINETQRLI